MPYWGFRRRRAPADWRQSFIPDRSKRASGRAACDEQNLPLQPEPVQFAAQLPGGPRALHGSARAGEDRQGAVVDAAEIGAVSHQGAANLPSLGRSG